MTSADRAAGADVGARSRVIGVLIASGLLTAGLVGCSGSASMHPNGRLKVTLDQSPAGDPVFIDQHGTLYIWDGGFIEYIPDPGGGDPTPGSDEPTGDGPGTGTPGGDSPSDSVGGSVGGGVTPADAER